VSRSNILFLMGILCVFGLLIFAWTTQGSSLNYLSENLKLSSNNVQRIYSAKNFYWKVSIKIKNTGQSDANLSCFYLSGSMANSTMVPPKTGDFSFETLYTVIKPGETREFVVSIDSSWSLAVFDKVTISAYSSTNKMYNLAVNLI